MSDSSPRFQVVYGRNPPDHPGSFHVFLGMPSGGPGGVSSPACFVDSFEAASLANLKGLNPRLFIAGLTVVVSPRDYPAHRSFMDQAVKHLAFTYCKYVRYPLLSFLTPDQFNLRTTNGVCLGAEINRLSNLSLFFRHPVADKLAEARVGRPVLLLLPGPSLESVGSHLRDMARKCLVACLSRSLDFCLRNGVEPDFVIQLDVHSIQPHFYPAGRDFPRSTLVCLPLAEVSGLAERFARVFFMVPFSATVTPNTFRIRESWLSSFIACLGLAEVLAAGEVFVAGADLCLGRQGQRYAGSEQGGAVQDAPPFPPDRPVRSEGPNLVVPDRNGREALTPLPYFATATEAEYVALEMAENAGTRFYSLGEAGILDPEVFLPARPEDLAGREDVDREAVAGLLDRAHSRRETIDSLRLKVEFLKHRETYLANQAQIRAAAASGEWGQLADNGYILGAQQFWDYVRDRSDPESAKIALNQLELAQELAQGAVSVCNVHVAIKRGRPVWIVCLEDETGSAGAEAAAIFPGIAVRPLVIWARSGPQPEEPGTVFVPFSTAFDNLRDRKPLLVTRRAFAEFRTQFRILPLPNALPLGIPPAC